MLSPANETQEDSGPKNGSNGEEEDDGSSDDEDLGSPIFKNMEDTRVDEPAEQPPEEPADAGEEEGD